MKAVGTEKRKTSVKLAGTLAAIAGSVDELAALKKSWPHLSPYRVAPMPKLVADNLTQTEFNKMVKVAAAPTPAAPPQKVCCAT